MKFGNHDQVDVALAASLTFKKDDVPLLNVDIVLLYVSPVFVTCAVFINCATD